MEFPLIIMNIKIAHMNISVTFFKYIFIMQLNYSISIGR